MTWNVAGAGWLVSATGLAGLLGRIVLAWLADRLNVRRYAGGIFAVQAATLALIATIPGAPVRHPLRAG